MKVLMQHLAYVHLVVVELVLQWKALIHVIPMLANIFVIQMIVLREHTAVCQPVKRFMVQEIVYSKDPVMLRMAERVIVMELVIFLSFVTIQRLKMVVLTILQAVVVCNIMAILASVLRVSKILMVVTT